MSLAACGRLGFDAAAPADASVDDAPPADACALGPWGTPVPLTSLNLPSFTEFGPSISNDGLRIYFDSDRPGTGGSYDIYGAFRISTSDSFGGASKIAGIDTGAFEANSTWTADELDLVYSEGNATQCLNEATRGAIGDAWDPPVTIGITCGGANDAGGGALSADGLRLYFNDRRDPESEGVIFVTERANRTSPWGAPVAVAGLDAGDKGYPTISGDELTMYYEQATGSMLSIFQVTRAQRTDAFGPPSRPPGFPASADDSDPSVTTDGHAMVFSSQRAGTPDLYLVTRGCM